MICPAKVFSFEDLSEFAESYSMNRLPASEMDQFEEHLMICHDCQDAVTAADEFSVLFREASVNADSLACA
jgi:Putative zinc-finger